MILRALEFACYTYATHPKLPATIQQVLAPGLDPKALELTRAALHHEARRSVLLPLSRKRRRRKMDPP